MIKLITQKINYVKKVTISLFFLATFLLLSINLFFQNNIFPNIYVANVYLGNTSKDEAFKKISDIKLNEKVILKVKDQEKKLEVSEILEDIDKTATIDRAYNLTHSGNFISDLETKVRLIVKPINLSLKMSFDDTKLEEYLTIVTQQFGDKPVYPSANIENNKVYIDQGKDGVEFDKDKAIRDIKDVISYNKNEKVEISLNTINTKLSDEQINKYKEVINNVLGKKIELKFDFDTLSLSDSEIAKFINHDNTYNQKLIQEKISEIAKQINRIPQDSVFVVSNSIVTEFTPSKDGITVDEDKLTSKITDALDVLLTNSKEKIITIEIPTIKYEPKIKNEDINNLGIKTLIGKGVSHFKGSIPNRIHNVNLAQSKFKGILVPPNEVFSFNQILGDVSALTGYKSAYVIKDGKTVLGDGGGICQVSTTLFRAVLSAGLPVVERRAHSYRVGYYEQGFAPGIDATVFYPTTDFKFKNDTNNYVLIQPTIDNKNYTLIFEIYGTNDGRVSNITKPVISSTKAPEPDLYVDDATLPQGTIKQIEHRAYGAIVNFEYTVTKDGAIINHQKFTSNYRPWQAVYLRGTATP